MMSEDVLSRLLPARAGQAAGGGAAARRARPPKSSTHMGKMPCGCVARMYAEDGSLSSTASETISKLVECHARGRSRQAGRDVSKERRSEESAGQGGGGVPTPTHAAHAKALWARRKRRCDACWEMRGCCTNAHSK